MHHCRQVSGSGGACTKMGTGWSSPVSYTLAAHRRFTTEGIDTFDPILYTKVTIDAFSSRISSPTGPGTTNTERLSIAMQGNFEDSVEINLKTLLEFERMIDELPEPIVRRIIHSCGRRQESSGSRQSDAVCISQLLAGLYPVL